MDERIGWKGLDDVNAENFIKLGSRLREMRLVDGDSAGKPVQKVCVTDSLMSGRFNDISSEKARKRVAWYGAVVGIVEMSWVRRIQIFDQIHYGKNHPGED